MGGDLFARACWCLCWCWRCRPSCNTCSSIRTRRGLLPFLNRLLAIAFNLLIIAIISRHIFRTERPNSETIFGALCIYLLLGFAFASVYSAIENRLPGAFYLTPTLNAHLVPDRFDFVYFSFGTLTELGSPGITAVAAVGRSVSLLEAILGVMYLAVLISRLISAYRSAETVEEVKEVLAESRR